MRSVTRPPRFARASLLLAAACLLLYVVGAGARVRPTGVVPSTAYYAALFLAALACVGRGLGGPRPRRRWLVLGTGMALWTVGDLAYVYALGPHPPIPSIADGLYLAFYPAAYIALVALVRDRLEHTSRALVLDGLVAALAVAAVAVAAVVGVVADRLGGDTVTNTVNLAYPIADTFLLGLVVGMLALTGWRPGRALIVTCVALGVLAGADGLYAYTTAVGAYTPGLQDVGWPLGMILLGWAAWQPVPPRSDAPADGWRVVAVPIALGFLSLGVLVLDHVRHVPLLAVALAAAALVAMMARLALTFGERSRLLATTREESLTDALTGLRNRRALRRDLDAVIGGRKPHLLLLFDLNGFKLYNDAFGHPAGDALLVRLSRELDRACAPGGAYRMGGDEFCALLPLTAAASEPELVARALEALSAEGEAFSISASWGGIALPDEAATSRDALRLADQRMYAQKHSRRLSARRQSTDVLLRVLEERHPDLRDHLRTVSLLAGAVAERLGLEDNEREQVMFAAELHDVGKVAIPDRVLGRAGSLDEEEWGLIRRHTLVGERIVAAAPALAGVARIIRATHERWDGGGYPDGLAGEAIPLAARIVAVCDAWEAITCGRPYRAGRSRTEARAELRRSAGTQFDARVVDVFLAAELGFSAPVEHRSGVGAAN